MTDDRDSYRVEPDAEFADRLERALLRRLALPVGSSTDGWRDHDPIEVDLDDSGDRVDGLNGRRIEMTLLDTEPTPTEPCRRRRWPSVAAAAAVAATVAGGLVLAVRDDPSETQVPAHPGTNAVADTPATTVDPDAAAAKELVDVAVRFIEARNAHDTATARSLLADHVEAPLMANNRMSLNMGSVPLNGDEVVLALEAEELYDVRYEPFACDWYDSRNVVSCTYSMDSRLRRIEGLPPIESRFELRVMDGLITEASFPWLSIGWNGGYRPVESGNFVLWLDGVHPDAIGPPPTSPREPPEPFGPSQLFYWDRQELIHILTHHTLDLLASYIDEYEQFRATAAPPIATSPTSPPVSSVPPVRTGTAPVGTP